MLPASCCMPPAACHCCVLSSAQSTQLCSPSSEATDSLHSLGACHDGSNQTFYTWPTTTTIAASTAGVKWRVAASGGKWQVAALLSICISSSSSGSPYRRRLLLLTDSWHKLTSKRPSIRCEPVAIGIEWAGASQACCLRLSPSRPAVIR